MKECYILRGSKHTLTPPTQYIFPGESIPPTIPQYLRPYEQKHDRNDLRLDTLLVFDITSQHTAVFYQTTNENKARRDSVQCIRIWNMEFSHWVSEDSRLYCNF